MSTTIYLFHFWALVNTWIRKFYILNDAIVFCVLFACASKMSLVFVALQILIICLFLGHTISRRIALAAHCQCCLLFASVFDLFDSFPLDLMPSFRVLLRTPSVAVWLPMPKKDWFKIGKCGFLTWLLLYLPIYHSTVWFILFKTSHLPLENLAHILWFWLQKCVFSLKTQKTWN